VSAIEIRRAKPGDEATILELLRELAEYERLMNKFRLTPEDVTAISSAIPRPFLAILLSSAAIQLAS